MSEPHGKHGLLRRLSLRRRRGRSPAPGPGSSGGESAPSRPGSPTDLTSTRSPASDTGPTSGPASPAPTPTTPTQNTSRSTSTSTLDTGLGPLTQRDVQDDGLCQRPPSLYKAEAPGETEGSGKSSATAVADTASTTTSDAIYDETAADADLNRVLLSRLECPVCYQPMAPPIRQCLYGHSVCAGCEARLARCPTCRGAFLPAPATNATLNAIAVAVRLPCRHRAAGCRLHLPLAAKARHEEHCRYRAFPCPAAPPRCGWTGTIDCLLEHTLSEHSATVSLISLNQYVEMSYTYSRTRPFELSEMESGVNRVSKTLLLVEKTAGDTSVDNIGDKNKNDKKTSGGKKHAKSERNTEDAKEQGKQEVEDLTPRALFRFHLHFDATLVVLQAALQYVGPPSNCKLFRYKVSVASRDGSFKLSACCGVTSDDVDEAVRGGQVLKVDGTAFRHLIDSEGRFLVRVKVAVARLPSLTQPFLDSFLE